MHIAKLALLAALILSVPVSAKVPIENLLALARSQALVLMGLSPAGAEIYARRAVDFSEKKGRFDAVSRLRALQGEELSRKAPDRLRVAKLSEAIAEAEARDARSENEELVATAFQLPEVDRRQLGKVIARNNGTALGF
jgi:hypothetical protein